MDAIIKATLQVLDQVGMAKLTTTRVAERAGVSVGTLYQYYPDKASLVTALKTLDGQKILSALSAVVAEQRGRPIADVMRALIATTLTIKHAKRSYVFALTDADRAAMAQLVEIIAPLLPVKHASMRASLLVAALDGPIVHAAKYRPAALKSPVFLDELCALAMGYLERCRKLDRAKD